MKNHELKKQVGAPGENPMTRRKFLIASSVGTISYLMGRRRPGRNVIYAKSGQSGGGDRTMVNSRVAVVETDSRSGGVERAISLLDFEDEFSSQEVLLKPNFNTADPFPASTHNDTLVAIVENLRKLGAGKISIGERSGPPPTAQVFEDKGIYELTKEHGLGLINFDELPGSDLPVQRPELSHWRDGFRVAAPILEAEKIVTTCCLKTHQFGGEFTMSLKLSVGIIPRKGYDYMSELHSSPNMRKMIAEINQVYSPDLIIMDALEVFTDGGPSFGEKKKANLIIAGRDRVAVDAVGLAVLKTLGSNREIMSNSIFEQEQIKRAADLGLGARAANEIELVGREDNPEIISRIQNRLS